MALNLIVKVHPVVLFQIVNAYERRSIESHRVIGTLLGTVEKGVVEVTNCFCVPHKEYKDQVEAELNYAMDLYDLNHRVNAQENIVGWWASGNEVTTHSSVIHEYYARECNNPVHLTVDTTLENTTRMGIKAYVCVQLGVPNGKQGCMFTPAKVQYIEGGIAPEGCMLFYGPKSVKDARGHSLRVTLLLVDRLVPIVSTPKITCYEPEVVGLNLCAKTQFQNQIHISGVKPGGVVEPMMDLAQIAEASTKLSSMLEQVLQYVDDVLAGKQPPDNQIGRALLDMVNSVPKMSSEQFDEMFNSNVKDLLMVIALSQLIKTQLQLNEKLTLLTTV